MNPDPGTYVLILQCRSEATIEVGKWGQLKLGRGYYIYVGSAFGPGCVRARVKRHFRSNKPTRWHIDYLREFAEPICAWCSHNPSRLEHLWAQIFSNMANFRSIKGFGCSDCHCYSHLFFTHDEPRFSLFCDMAQDD